MILRSQYPSHAVRWAGAAALGLMLSVAAQPAQAADEDANADPKASTAPDDDADGDAPKPKTAEPAASAPPAPTPAAAEPEAVGLVERLPPTAYPAPVVRGLHGGSLWLSSQGTQWPYLPRTTIGISGYGWLDTSYRKLTDGDPAATADRKDTTAQGRLVLRVTPTYSKGEWFAQAQAEFVANKSQVTPPLSNVDDLWIRIGKWQAYDLTVGRFEGFEVYHLGMGLDLNTDERSGAFSNSYSPPALYGASFLYYRPDEASNVALHAYPTNNLRLELLGQFGNSGPFNALGGRPAAIFDLGWLKLKAAAEYQLLTDPRQAKGGGTGFQTKSERRGAAGSAQFVFDPYVELGANVGYALVDGYDPNGNLLGAGSTTTTSFGGFLNARIVPDLLAGLGVNKVHQSDQHVQNGRFGEFAHLQAFGALQYFWENTLMVKLVVGYAKGDSDATFVMTPAFSNKLVSARLRFQLLF
jgi:hypothetical protein